MKTFKILGLLLLLDVAVCSCSKENFEEGNTNPDIGRVDFSQVSVATAQRLLVGNGNINGPMAGSQEDKSVPRVHMRKSVWKSTKRGISIRLFEVPLNAGRSPRTDVACIWNLVVKRITPICHMIH